MAYATVADVESHIPSAGTFDGSSTPTTSEVSAWIDQASAICDRYLSSAGYTVPVSSGTGLYKELTYLSATYAAALAIQALGLDVITGDNQSKSQAMLEHVHEHLMSMIEMDLTGSGGEPDPDSQGGSGGRGLRMIQMRRVDAYSRDARESEDVEEEFPDV